MAVEKIKSLRDPRAASGRDVVVLQERDDFAASEIQGSRITSDFEDVVRTNDEVVFSGQEAGEDFQGAVAGAVVYYNYFVDCGNEEAGDNRFDVLAFVEELDDCGDAGGFVVRSLSGCVGALEDLFAVALQVVDSAPPVQGFHR